MHLKIQSQIFTKIFLIFALLIFATTVIPLKIADASHLTPEEETACRAGTLQCKSDDPSCKKGLVPCGRLFDVPDTPILECQDCSFCHFFYMFDNIINFILWRVVPTLALLLITGSGFMFVVSRANQASLSTAKNLIIFTVIGWAVAFVSWMLINSLLSVAGVKEWTGLTSWWKFACEVPGSNPPAPPTILIPAPTPQPFAPPGATEIPAPIPAPHPEARENQWTSYNREIPGGNKINHSTVVFTDTDGREKIWVIGGYSEHAEDAVLTFDGIKWESKPKLPAPRGDHAAVVFNDEIWVIGGRDEANSIPDSSNSVLIFNRDTNIWRNSAIGIPGRYHHTAVVYNNKIWIIGGYERFLGRENQVWSCDTTNDTTSCTDNATLFDFPEDGIVDHAAVVYNDGNGEKIWVMGGREGPDNEREIWTFDGSRWTKMATKVPAPGITGGHSVAVFPDSADNYREKIWVVAGREGTLEEKRFWEPNGSNVWVFDGAAWAAKPALPDPAGRVDHTAAVFKDPRDDKKKIWIIGGFNNDLAYSNDLWLFTPPDRAISPAPPVKKVFVTAEQYPANLFGIVGADEKCQTSAKTQGLTGNYMAWLSDDSASPATPSSSRNFTQHDGPYVLLDNTVIANNWLGLTDGYLKAPINKTQTGAIIGNQYAWTGTDVFGKAATNSQFCKNWTSDRSLTYLNAQLGNVDLKDPRWSEGAINIYCETERHLYCIEQ